MKKINNPFIAFSEHKCFCCSPNNPVGLKLQFWYNEDDKSVETTWNPESYLQGYPNVLHGGIQSTLMDEVASWALYVLLETAGVTSKMEIKYKKPVYVNRGPIKVKAILENVEKRFANFRTSLYDSDNNLCSEGIVQYYFYPKEIAHQQLNYPGIDAFLG